MIRFDLLEVLAKFLDEMPNPEQFYYGKWIGDGWKGHVDLSCGTTACAGGWAGTLPEFKEAGFELVRGLETGGGFWRGLTQVLGLNHWSTNYLFYPGTFYYVRDEHRPEGNKLVMVHELDMSPEDYGTAKEVAEHIRRFVQYLKDNGVTEFPKSSEEQA